MPKGQHHPSPEERDERVKVDLAPDKFIAGVMETGPGEDEGEESNRDSGGC